MTGANAASQAANRPLRKFNPGTHQSDEEVIQQFVVRKRELDTVLEVLRGNVDSPSCQHVLLVGPRGRGKTMLLVRTAAELRTDQQLAKWLFPVRFMEESQEIFNVADFWLETLFHLANETAEQDRGLSQDLRQTHRDLSSRWREQSLEALARAAVLEAADRLDRKLVLMVENLQSLCENVDEDFGWKLRGALQSEPQVMMLLSSSTSRFEGLDDAEQPFFELFRTINLQPLDTDACRLLWQVVSGDTVSLREIRPLQILTGGNPRLLVIVAEFGRHRSLRRLMEELVTLIDEHTEYFRGHLEVLAKTERRVYVSVMDLWQPSSAGEIATRARMDVRVVSTMLGRLVERGAVNVEGRGRKRFYAPSEPLYSIYYKLRRERDEAAIVECLIKFMVVFYNIRELSEISEQLYLEARESPVLRAGMDRALEKMSHAEEVDSSIKWDFVREAADKVAKYDQGMAERRLEKDITSAFQGRAWERVIEIVDQVFTSGDAESRQLSEVFIARILHLKGVAYAQLGDFQGIIAACEELVRRCGYNRTKEVKQRVAITLMQKVRAKKELGDLEGAIVACEEVVEHYGNSNAIRLQMLVAMALDHKGRLRKEMDDVDGAISAWEEVVERYGDSNDPNLQIWVATALTDEAEARKKLGDTAGAVALNNIVIERYADSTVPDLQFWVAASLVHKAEAIKEQGDPGGALSICEEVVKRFGESNAPDVQGWVAGALIDRGRLRKELDDPEGAVANFQEVVERYGDSDALGLQKYIAGALIDKGRTKKELRDAEGAIASWDDMVERYGDSDVSDLQRFVIGALVDKGRCQAELGRADEALRVCEQLEKRVHALSDNGSGQFAWQAMCIRALALMIRNESVAAMEVFCSVYAAVPPDNEVGLNWMLWLIPNLVAAGASERELVAVLLSDPAKSGALAPLVVALRERQGETVRAPAEVREVAADVRERIEERVRSWAETTAGSPRSGR